MASVERTARIINRIASTVIPILLFGAVGYVTWVFVALICVRYFAKPSTNSDVPRREGIALVFLILYFFLLIFMSSCYLRLYQVILTDPGYIGLPKIPRNKNGRPSQRRGDLPVGAHRGVYEVNEPAKKSDEPILDYLGIVEGRTMAPAGLEKIYQKDAFVCDARGLPIFCNSCWNWKPDRTHHCSEVNRCVRRMDHFCPWVGGIISETTMKFFMQFVCYAFMFCSFLLASTAFAISDRQSKIDKVEIHWIICLAMAGLFMLLSFGMMLNTIQLALKNLTTVERLWRGDRAYYIALLVPNQATREARNKEPVINHPYSWEKPKALNTISYPLQSEKVSNPPEVKRTFIVVSTSAADNPWNLGRLKNVQEILGNHWLDWILPIRYSPHCNHGRSFGHFPYGSELQALRKAHGLVEPHALSPSASIS